MLSSKQALRKCDQCGNLFPSSELIHWHIYSGDQTVELMLCKPCEDSLSCFFPSQLVSKDRNNVISNR
jgi:hypothetical protein